MQELNLGKLVRFYLRYSWVVVLAALLGGLVGLFYSRNVLKPEYRSDSTVILNQHQSSSDSTLINNYITLLKSRKVLEPIIEKNARGMNYASLHQNISIVNEKATEIITISVTAQSPEMAQAINASLIESFNLDAMGLRLNEKDAETGQIVTVIDKASYNPAPVNVKTTQNMMVLMGGGVVVTMVVLFVVFDYTSSRALRVVPRYVSRRSKVVGAVVAPVSTQVEARPQIVAGEVSRDEQKGQEVEADRIKQIKREATDILDVLQNIGGVELTR